MHPPLRPTASTTNTKVFLPGSQPKAVSDHSLGFVTPFWRNVTLSFAAACAFYKYAPRPSDETYLTQWLAMYIPSPDYWLDINAKHTALSKLISDDSHLLRSAQAPIVRRYRYPT